jgi:hypothetical protein
MDVEEEAGGSVGLPGLAAGGRMERTGIAPVHEGEHAGPVINYHFPVEIQAVGSLPESESTQLIGQVFDQLGRELAGRL